MQREKALDVLTVFDGEPPAGSTSPWDLSRGFATAEESVAARRLEDDAAFAGTPHRRFSLPLLDHQYGEARSESDAALLTDFVRAWIAENEGGIVALPLGGGGRGPSTIPRGPFGRLLRHHRPAPHPDHQFARDVALAELRTAAAVKPLLYEEFPYLLGSRRLKRRHFPDASSPWTPLELAVHVSLDEKLRRLHAYGSQLEPLPGQVDWLAFLPPVERYWMLVLPPDRSTRAAGRRRRTLGS